jgi:hypothetical protein
LSEAVLDFDQDARLWVKKKLEGRGSSGVLVHERIIIENTGGIQYDLF